MPEGPLNPKEYGFYIEVAQVGLEMVAPVGVGLALDHYLRWSPWGVVVGAVLGLIAGVGHLASLLNRQDKDSAQKPPQL
jgi:F0F1-type ATP synthase assembly protein I